MHPYITTFSGRHVDLLDPKPEQIHIVDIAHSLSRLARFNGHTAEPYSVAQHSVMVSRSLPRDKRLAGLMHDAVEAYIGDMVTPVKRALSPAALGEIRRIEARLNACLSEALEVEIRHDPQIKWADTCALAAEARRLMSAPIDCLPPEATPLFTLTHIWHPEKAQSVFLAEFERLQSRRLSSRSSNFAITIA